MSDAVITGLFGKLPAHGDFVHRNLSTEFMSIWDEWLQHYIAGSQEQIGENWLDVYLTSPVWHFMLSAGTIDDSAWGGIVLPSVDKIGRYFPFSIVTRLPSHLNSLEFLLSKNSWFDEVEELALVALDGYMNVDELINELESVDINYNAIYTKNEVISTNKPVVISMDFEEQSPSSISDYVLDALLLQSLTNYSAWTTRGSEHVLPSVFYSQGLPPINGISAMMSGQWSQWNWQLPYQLNAV